MTSDVDAIIVGAGPAGLSAALELATAGASVMLIDDNAVPGGQYFRHPARGWSGDTGLLSNSERRCRDRLFGVVTMPNVTYLPATTAWHVPDTNTLAITGARSGRVTAPFLVFATGAHDWVVPFPGWTSNYVITAGGTLNLIKEQAMVPDGRVAVAGAGPLLFAVAGAMSKLGVQVQAVIDDSRCREPISSALRMATGSPSLFFRGLQYRARLWRQGTSYIRRGAVTAIEEKSDELVVSVQCDGGRALQVPCDYVVTGHGLSPSTELLNIMGCQFSYRGDLGGWVPDRSNDLETSATGVFAIGDGASIAGAANAIAEGALVGKLIARRLGQPGKAGIRTARAALRRIGRFQRGLRRFFLPNPALYLGDLEDDTVICRCEDVTAETIRSHLSAGADLEQIKACTRASMGRCQGRFCLKNLAVLAAGTTDGIETVRQPRCRPPARLIKVNDLSHEPLDPPKPPVMLLP